MTYLALSIYLVPMLIIWSLYLGWHNSRQRKATCLRDEAVEAGLTQPASLHPVIDTSQCVGCRSCVSACPEKNVLGMIGVKAELVSPVNCIGHGACKTACPMGAILLYLARQNEVSIFLWLLPASRPIFWVFLLPVNWAVWV